MNIMADASKLRGLYGIADSCVRPEIAMGEKVLAFVEGGAAAVQVRMKGTSARELWKVSCQARELAAGRALVIVNDRPDVAMAARADGIHLGEEDLPLEAARRLVGPDMLIGATVRSLEQARAAVAQGADYLGFGPIWSTNTKSLSVAPRGLALLSQVAQAVPVPVVAIGGITLERAPEVARAGAAAAAVVSDVLEAVDMRERARQLARAWPRAVSSGP
jgi:thiamine-phosphate pyrophosphorylase